MSKIPVGILGATGMVGQHYLRLLENHPWFEVTFLAASSKSSGKTFQEAIQDRLHIKESFSERVLQLKVHAVDAIKEAQKNCLFLFSALEKEAALQFETLFAAADLPIVSNASAHRNDPDVPVLIPEINPHHLEILAEQRKKRGWKKGFIVTKPNCSLQSYLAPLYAIHRHFPVRHVVLTTLQAASGAGYPGTPSLDLFDNVIPYISGEEEKSELEPLKILGSIEGSCIQPSKELIFSAHCNRVPILEGHLACVSLNFQDKVPSQEQILSLWEKFRGMPQELALPSAPKQPIFYRSEVNRPQPRLDRDQEGGMAITVGRLRPCQSMTYKFVGLSHNIERGAAGGGILNAELLNALNFLTFS